jgi:hypothetical protein
VSLDFPFFFEIPNPLVLQGWISLRFILYSFCCFNPEPEGKGSCLEGVRVFSGNHDTWRMPQCKFYVFRFATVTPGRLIRRNKAKMDLKGHFLCFFLPDFHGSAEAVDFLTF